MNTVPQVIPRFSWIAPALVGVSGFIGPMLTSGDALTWIACGCLLVLVGLPHGAVDHVTYHHALGRSDISAPLRFLAPYLIGLAAFVVCFLWFPWFSTWTFLGLSSWHFGQSHLSTTSHSWVRRIRGLALGGCLIAMLLRFNPIESEHVLGIWMSHVEAQSMVTSMTTLVWVFSLIWAVLTLWDWLTCRDKKSDSVLLATEGTWMLVVWWLSMRSELLWSFTAYFCLGHAIDSWRMEFHQHQRVTKNFLSYYVLAMPFSMIAIAGLFTVAWASVEGLLPWKMAWGILLAGTVPHMILLDHWAPIQSRSD